MAALNEERAELRHALRLAQSELSEAEKRRIKIAELHRQLAATGDGEKTIERYESGLRRHEGYLADDDSKSASVDT